MVGGDAAERAVRGRVGAPALASRLRGRRLLAMAALAALYYGAAKVGYAFEFAGPVAAIVWLPVGVGTAVLYLGGPGLWPGVLVGDLLANDYSALPFGSALGQTGGNVLEVLVASLLLRRLVPDRSPLQGIDTLGRMLVALVSGAAVSATVGPLSLWAGGVIDAHDLPEIARTWWLGDATGALIVVPLAVAWWPPPRLRPKLDARLLEAVLMLVAVAGLSQLAFGSENPLTYLAFPPLIWAALRFGQQGATLAITVAAGFTVWNTTHFHGPFVFHSISTSVSSAQLYIAITALSTLCLAAVVSERGRFAEGLSASRSRLVAASDTERRRLEHNLHDGAQQRLTALAIRLGVAAERALRDGGPDAALLEQAGDEVTVAIDELRVLAHGLHPAVLTDLGLGSAIKDVSRRSTIPVAVGELPSTRVDGTAEVTAFYVFAEALTNAQKHAAASSIRVRTTTTGRTLHIEIVDDGVGGAAESAGNGLRGLRDRVEAIGGTLTIDSPVGQGTRVAAALPAGTRSA
jgi:signal transduction histidine kinase